MTDVFISYSRKDIAFARLLHEALIENGLDTWIDWQDIPPSADWLAEVYEAIEAADAFVFVISDTSLLSEICGLEINHAAKHNKRLIPIVIKDVEAEKVPKELSVLNWIFFDDAGEKFAEAMEDLVTAIKVDQAWVKSHTRFQNRALDWERKEKDRGLLLRGADLSEAEAWLSGSAEKDPQPTALQTQFILKSREDATRRQRMTLLGVGAALVVAVGLGVLAWTQRNEALTQRNRAISKSLVLEADQQYENQFDLGLLLNLEAYRIEESMDALGGILKGITSHPYIRSNIFRAPVSSPYTLIVENDKNKMVALFPDDMVRVWNIENGDLLAELSIDPGPGGYRSSFLAFNIDGSQLAAKTVDGVLSIWDADDYTLIETQYLAEANNYFRGLSPDFSILVITDANQEDKPVMIVERSTGEVISKLAAYDRAPFFFDEFVISENNQILAGLNQHEANIHLWDVKTGELLCDPLQLSKDTGYSGAPNFEGSHRIHFLPDSTQLAVSMKEYLYVFSVPDGELVHLLNLGDLNGTRIAFFDPEQAVISSLKSRNLLMHDIWTGDLLGSLDMNLDKYHAIKTYAMTSDLRTVFSANSLTSGSVIYEWSLANNYLVNQHLPDTQYYRTLMFKPDEKAHLLAAGGCSEITGEHLGNPTCGKGKLTLFQTEPEFIEIQSVDLNEDWILSLAWNNRGDLLATGSEDGVISLRDPESLEEIRSWDHTPGEVKSLAFSPDGTMLAAGTPGTTDSITLYSIPSGEYLNVNLNDFDDSYGGNWGPYQVLFSPDGRYLAANGNGLTIWETTTWKVVSGPHQNMAGHGETMQFSSEGRWIYTGNRNGINRFDLETMEWTLQAQEIQDTPPLIYHLAADPKDEIGFTITDHLDLILWDIPTGEMLAPEINSAINDHIEWFIDVEYDPSGRSVYATYAEVGIVKWDMRIDAWIAAACKLANRNLTESEWGKYIGVLPYRETCP